MTGTQDIGQALEPILEQNNLIIQDLGTRLKVTPITEPAVVDVDESELGMSESEHIQPVSFEEGSEFDLPVEVNVEFVDPDQDYQTGSVRERRVNSRSAVVNSVSVPLTMSANEARVIARLINMTTYFNDPVSTDVYLSHAHSV